MINPRRIIIGLICALAILTLLQLTGVMHIFHRKSTPATASPFTKGELSGNPSTSSNNTKQTSSGKTPTNTSNVQPGDQKNNTGSPTTTTFLSPTGDFVSAHNVNLNSSLVSVCNTSPGASCKITFTAGDGTVRALEPETTDSGGSAYWNNWTPSSIGLSPGTWTIRAVAVLNGQTKTAQDAMDLTVTQ